MIIVGIGVDLVSVERTERMVKRFGHRFFSRFFNDSEKVPSKIERVASRIAAKEAVLKVLKTGLSKGMRWRDVEIVGGEAAAPEVRLHNTALLVAEQLSIKRIHLSLTHQGGFAVAVAVGEA